MRCNFKQKYDPFNFDTQKEKDAILNTWQEFRDALANREFSYDETDKALNSTFLKVFDDLLNSRCEEMETTIGEISNNWELRRGAKVASAAEINLERFIPKACFINEDNRFSPRGVEWLYLAMSSNAYDAEVCTKKECRAQDRDGFAICEFEMNSNWNDRKVINLTNTPEKTYEQINYILQQQGKKLQNKQMLRGVTNGIHIFMTPEEREMVERIKTWSISTYRKLLSEEIFVELKNIADKELKYAPFQCLAKYIESKGYVGIVYKSTVYPKAKDIVLFDKNIARPKEIVAVDNI